MLCSTDLSRIALEGHQQGATIYVAGYLADCAAARIEDLVRGLALETRVIRVDLRPVHVIDPRAFVRVVRALSAWRDARGGRVVIEFPERSARSAAVPLRLATHMASTASAVITASSWPTSTSPG